MYSYSKEYKNNDDYYRKKKKALKKIVIYSCFVCLSCTKLLVGFGGWKSRNDKWHHYYLRHWGDCTAPCDEGVGNQEIR